MTNKKCIQSIISNSWHFHSKLWLLPKFVFPLVGTSFLRTFCMWFWIGKTYAKHYNSQVKHLQYNAFLKKSTHMLCSLMATSATMLDGINKKWIISWNSLEFIIKMMGSEVLYLEILWASDISDAKVIFIQALH